MTCDVQDTEASKSEMLGYPLLWQIRNIVTGLNKKNLKSSVAELNQIIELYGHDARVLQLQCLLESVDFKAIKDGVREQAPKLQLLQHAITQCVVQKNFVSVLCQAVEGAAKERKKNQKPGNSKKGHREGHEKGDQAQDTVSEEYLSDLCIALRLAAPEVVALALALSRSHEPETRQKAVRLLKKRLPEVAGGGGGRLGEAALQVLLEFVLTGAEASRDSAEAKALARQLQEGHQGGLGGIGEEGAAKEGADSGNARVLPDILSLDPVSTEHAWEMNFLNSTSSNGSTMAASLAAEAAAVASSLGGAGSLAGFLGDLGPACTASPSAFRMAIRESGVAVDERQVARLLAALAVSHRTGGGSAAELELSTALTGSLLASSGTEGGIGSELSKEGGWNLEVVRQVLATDYGNKLDWVGVAHEFDHPEFNVPDQVALIVLLQLYRTGAKADLPTATVFGRWSNRRGHLSLLRAAISAPPQLYSFKSSPWRQPILEGVDPAVTPNEAWLSLDLFATLLALAGTAELYSAVRDLLTAPAFKCPELLLLGLAAVPQAAGGKLRAEMLSRLLPLYFRPNRNVTTGRLMQRLFIVNPGLLRQSCEEAFNTDATLPSILHLLKVLRYVPPARPVLLEAEDPTFALCMACVSHTAERPNTPPEERLDLEGWLAERLRRDGVPVAACLLSFVGQHMAAAKTRIECQQPAQQAGARAPAPEPGGEVTLSCAVSVETLAAMLRVVTGPAGESAMTTSPQLQSAAVQLVDAARKIHPVMDGRAGAQRQSIDQQMHQAHQQQPAATELESVSDVANAYFQRVYTSEQSIPEMLEMLRRFQTSEISREHEIFSCMIHNLFDEYRFFDKYPDKELRITGILFGALIQHQLVASITLGIALRYVLEALRKPPQGKMFRFGLFALEQFKSRLNEWPQYCAHIIQIPHIAEQNPQLVQDIERAMQRDGIGAGSLIAPTGDAAVAAEVSEQPLSMLHSIQQQHQQHMQQPQLPHQLLMQQPSQQTTPQMQGINSGGGAEDGLPSLSPTGLVDTGIIPPAIPVTANGTASANGEADASGQSGAAAPPGLDVPDIDSLMVAYQKPMPPVEQPPDAVMDRIHFVINNVSPSNLESKVGEIRAHIAGHPENHAWMANYLVVKRISTQPNFHGLYLQFIDMMDAPGLLDAVLRSVFHNVGKLLRSGKIITSTTERSLLKNLGSWLGQITLARNRPVLQRQLDLKELLFRGYETGRLIAVTPFVAKVLEGAQHSTVFQPPNPWLMGILSALHEMYALQDLKMNIKFEVEMLVKKLNIRLEAVPKYGRLARRRAPNKEKNSDFNIKSQGQPQAPLAPVLGGGGNVFSNAPAETATSGAKEGGEKAAAAAGAEEFGAGDSSAGGERSAEAVTEAGGDHTVIPNLAAYVTISPSLQIFAAHPQLKRVVPVAVDKAIREIIQPVVERSVTIACITTKELVLKDFASEADDVKMRKASHLMVSNLAGSLALVTCKEPLRVSIGNHLRQLLSAASPTLDAQAVEAVVQQCSAENLELGCMLIEKAATEKAMRDMDEALAPALTARRKHRETTGQPYYDAGQPRAPSRYPAALPELLRPKPGSLQSSQLLVYEAFTRQPRSAAAAAQASGRAATPTPPAPAAAPTPVAATIPRPTSAAGGAAPPAVKPAELSVEGALQAWQGAMGRLDVALQQLLNQAAAAGRGGELSLGMVGSDSELSAALHEVVAVGQCVAPERKEDALVAFAQGIFQRLFEMAQGKEDSAADVPLLRVEVLVAVLELCLRNLKRVAKDEVVTRWYTSRAPPAMLGEGERKLEKAALTMFIRAKMVRIPEVDVYVARNMTWPPPQQPLPPPGSPPTLPERSVIAWAEFGMSLIRQCVFDQFTQAILKEFAHVLEALSRVSQKAPGVKKQFDKLMDDLRARAKAAAGQQGLQQQPVPQQQQQQQLVPDGMQRPAAPSVVAPGAVGAVVSKGVVSAKAKAAAVARNDPPGAREQVTNLLECWIRTCSERPGDDKAYAPYLQLLQQQGALKMDEATERFFRVATELVVEACFKSARLSAAASEGGEDTEATPGGGPRPPALSYTVVDAYAKLLVLLVKSVNTPDQSSATTARVALLNKVLSTVVRVLLQDLEIKKELAAASGGAELDPAAVFDQRPYFRLLLSLLQDLNTPDRVLDSSNLQVLAAFASAFHVLQPSAAPGFAFAWLELISHRMFMPNLLLAKHQKGWMLMHRLLIDLFAFMEPQLRKPELGDSVRLLYRGMLRVLLVLLHDFPEFLCEHHFSLCDVIPPSCIQLRNLVLSAFPRSMRLPDPFTPNLKVDLLPEISQSPRILSNYTATLTPGGLRADLDGYLQTRHPAQFLVDLPARLRLQGPDAIQLGTTYNVPAISALVVYVGIQAIVQLQNKAANITHSAPMDVFQHLAARLDAEGRYFFLNAIANQLRYPNNHTHYFSCVLLYLFAEAQAEVVQEQITRILLERLIVHRPHPWGLLITFIELIKNPRYNFWSHSFTHCAPELERVFESVARSCMAPGGHGIPGEGENPAVQGAGLLA